MNDRRQYMKELAAQSAEVWGASATSVKFPGDTRIETKNTVYLFRDDVCFSVTQRTGKTDPSAMVNMRLIGWLMPNDAKTELLPRWRPGTYAVLWRPRAKGERHSHVALTSATLSFAKMHRSAAPPPMRARVSSDVELRSAGSGPRRTTEAPPGPPTLNPPPPPSMTRLTHSGIPSPMPMRAARKSMTG
jgi:hypothetical protein